MGTLKISDISCSRSQVNSLTSAYTCTGNGNGSFSMPRTWNVIFAIPLALVLVSLVIIFAFDVDAEVFHVTD